jgi:integrase
MSTFDVQFWALRTHPGRRRPYEVRWVVAGRQRSKSYATRALADSYRSELMTAGRRGETFNEATGLPESVQRKQPQITWIEHATAYAAMKWPRMAATSRRSIAESLTTVSIVLLRAGTPEPEPEAVRRALYLGAFNPSSPSSAAPADVQDALRWAQGASLPLSDLTDARVVRRALDACALTIKGQASAATVTRRRRAVLYNCLRYAVELGLLPANPIDTVQWTAPAVARSIDRRVVANAEQARALLEAVGSQPGSGPHLVAFFGCLYYAAMRPSEVIMLREGDCTLPAEGWGQLDLHAAAPHAGSAWTGDGQTRDVRGLKRRAASAMRVVPIPPALVQLLRGHLQKFGTADDGRLFRSQQDGLVQGALYGRVWRSARKATLTTAQLDSRLAARPYDLRHAGVSLWLNAGVPATEVADRAGHSVDVLLRVYASCLDGQAVRANAQIDEALNLETEPV